MAGAPDSAKLHDLLKAAARELKATQQELADERDLHEQARRTLDQERARNRELQQQLSDAQHALRKAQAEFATASIPRGAFTSAAADRTGRITIEPVDATATMPPMRVGDDKESTNVSRLDPEVLEKRVKALDQSLAEAEDEARKAKQRVVALEAEVEALKELARPRTAQTPAFEPSQVVDELKVRLATLESELTEARAAQAATEEQVQREQASARDVLSKFAAIEAELAAVRETAHRAGELEGQLASEKTRAWELEQQRTEAQERTRILEAEKETREARLHEVTTKLAHFESDLAGLRSRRDELNVEVARADSERKRLAARVTELEAAAQSIRDDEAKVRAELERQHHEALGLAETRRAEADGNFQKEKEKHQHTAQRLLEARQKLRELETQVAEVQTQLNVAQTRHQELERNAQAQRDALVAEHSQALLRERESHQQATQALQAHLAQVEKDLAHAITEWHHTNRQYEQLHREMLVLLDQRDEARRQLEALR